MSSRELADKEAPSRKDLKNAGIKIKGNVNAEERAAIARAVNPELFDTQMHQIQKLAGDIGLTRLWLVGNKVRNAEEADFMESAAPEGLPLLGWLPADLAVQEADRRGIAVFDHVPSLRSAAYQIVERLEEVLV